MSHSVIVRTRKPHRIQDLVKAASTVFLAKGYRQAQVADVARAMGVAPGTVYLYVDSKAALFDLVVRCAMDPGFVEGALEFPVRCPDESTTLEFVRKTLDAEARLPQLEAALRGNAWRNGAEELEAMVRELFRLTAKNWLALKLLERSAVDWPELADLWFKQHRPRIFGLLARYLENRMTQGLLRPAPDVPTAARLVIETVATFAMHCRAEAHSPPMDLHLAEAVVVDAIVNAYRPSVQNKSQPRKGRSKP